MSRRGWRLPTLAVALVGATLASSPTASADVAGRPGIRLVSHDQAGNYPDSSSFPSVLTDDGRWAIFTNDASDLTGDGHRGGSYLADVETGAVSRGPVPDQPVGLTPDGRYLVVAQVDAFNIPMSFSRIDRTDGSRVDIDEPGGFREISEDGDVLLGSEGALDPTDHPVRHWYAYDVSTGQSVDVDGDASGAGGESALLSRDGSTVVFTSSDPALDPTLGDGRVGVFRRRLADGTLEELSADAPDASVVGISRDGDVVLVSHGSRSRLITPAGTEALDGQGLQLSPDGRYLLTIDPAGGPDRQLYRIDRADGTRSLVTATASGAPASGTVVSARMSADGSVVAFTSTADGIVPGTVHGAHLYRRDVEAGTTELVCCNISSPVRTADRPVLSATGTRIVFGSPQRLEPADTHDYWDVFAWGDYPPITTTTTSTTSTSTTSTTSTTVPPTTTSTTSTTVPSTTTSTTSTTEPPTTTSTTSTTVPPTSTTSTTVPSTTTTSTTVPPPPVVPQASVLSTHAPEPGGHMTWTVLLDRPTTVPVTIRWWTFQDTSAPSNRRAAPDKDFKPAAGSVTFAPGETAKAVTSLVFDDSFFEADEWFVVELFDPTGATIGTGKATGTINDDESGRLWSLPTQLERLLPA